MLNKDLFESPVYLHRWHHGSSWWKPSFHDVEMGGFSRHYIRLNQGINGREIYTDFLNEVLETRDRGPNATIDIRVARWLRSQATFVAQINACWPHLSWRGVHFRAPRHSYKQTFCTSNYVLFEIYFSTDQCGLSIYVYNQRVDKNSNRILNRFWVII